MATITLAEAAGITDAITVTVHLSLAETATAADAANQPVALADTAGVADAVSFTQAFTLSAADLLAVTDGIAVVKFPLGAPVAGAGLAPASPAFIRSQMPRMHLQNLLTGQWLHRDVQGISSPLVTWALSTAGTFTCTLSPPRSDMLDSSGNILMNEWQTACYLEEDDEIKFGGILTSSSGQGPLWVPTFTEFNGYPSGMPYDGPDYARTDLDALDAVRYIWSWLQSQPDGNLGLVTGPGKAGTDVGATTTGGASSTLAKTASPGDETITVMAQTDPQTGFPYGSAADLAALGTKGATSQAPNAGFPPRTKITIGDESATVAPAAVMQLPDTVVALSSPLKNQHPAGSLVEAVQPPATFVLQYWNNSDCGQEISSIRAEAVFDYYEKHTWTDAAKTAVIHQLLFGVPRIGTRRDDLRFAETENIIQQAQITRDGTQFANTVIGLGAGQGSAAVRAVVSVTNGRLRRSFVYADQTVKTVSRMQAKAQKALASMSDIDTPTQIMVINHPNAPFGSFGPGDDIQILLAEGWRNAGIWCRITQMTQDPTGNLMTLTLARSDSFSYLATSGQAGTL